jgi:hypothetical protein
MGTRIQTDGFVAHGDDDSLVNVNVRGDVRGDVLEIDI